MAITDRTREALNFQKRGVSVAVCPFVESQITGLGSKFVQLPPRSMIVRVFINVLTQSTTGSSSLTVTDGTNNIAANIAVTAVGGIAGTVVAAQVYRATGAGIVVKPGATAPAAGNLTGELIVEYIELDKTTGEYTQITD